MLCIVGQEGGLQIFLRGGKENLNFKKRIGTLECHKSYFKKFKVKSHLQYIPLAVLALLYLYLHIELG